MILLHPASVAASLLDESSRKSVWHTALFLLASCLPAAAREAANETPESVARATTAMCVDCCATEETTGEDTRPAPGDGTVVSEWLAPESRPRLGDGALAFVNQDGLPVELRSQHRPVVLSFIYTRCDNPRKCPRVSRSMADLSSDLVASGLGDDCLLALVTYDPAFDQPAILRAYAESIGFPLRPGSMLLRPDPVELPSIFETLGVTVNYDRHGVVNIHGNQLLIIDREGRIAREYRVLLWDNAAVLADLKALQAEG